MKSPLDLGSRLNERQTDKLLDLASLEFLTQEFPKASPGGAAIERLTRMFRPEGDENRDALRQYLRLHKDKDVEEIEAGEGDDDPLLEAMAENAFARLATDNIWITGKDSKFHQGIWQLLDSEIRQLDDGGAEGTQGMFARLLLDLPQGLRKVLIRTDWIPRFHDKATPSDFSVIASALCDTPAAHIQDDYSDRQSPWDRTADFLLSLNESEGSLNRQSRRSSKRQGLWKGVFLGEETVHNEIQGGVYAEKRVNLCAAFNSPLAPDILICTSIGSEGIDLHRHCADVIHHDLPWNPAKLEQRTGRVDRVGSRVEMHADLARLRLNIGIPFLAHDYEQFQYELLLSRAQKFEILLGKPEFSADVDNEDQTDEDGEVTKVLETSPESHLGSEPGCLHLPEAIVRCLRMDLAVVPDSSKRLP